MKAIIRKDEQAVSPVIATILMVAITVVLAAVLYVMVSGLITGPGGAPRAMGVSLTRSGDGTNFILLFSNVPSGLTMSGTTLVVARADGSTNLTATAFSALAPATNGASYNALETPADATVEVGESILLRTSWYGTPSNGNVRILDGTSILFSGTLP